METTATTHETLSALSDDDLATLRHDAEMVGNLRAVDDCYKVQAERWLARGNEMIGHLDPRFYPR